MSRAMIEQIRAGSGCWREATFHFLRLQRAMLVAACCKRNEAATSNRPVLVAACCKRAADMRPLLANLRSA